MVVLALVAAVVVETLHDKAKERYQAQTALIELEEEAVHELWLQEEALGRGGVTADLLEGAEEARRETAELLEELEETDPGEGLRPGSLGTGLLRNGRGRGTAPERGRSRLEEARL